MRYLKGFKLPSKHALLLALCLLFDLGQLLPQQMFRVIEDRCQDHPLSLIPVLICAHDLLHMILDQLLHLFACRCLGLHRRFLLLFLDLFFFLLFNNLLLYYWLLNRLLDRLHYRLFNWFLYRLLNWLLNGFLDWFFWDLCFSISFLLS